MRMRRVVAALLVLGSAFVGHAGADGNAYIRPQPMKSALEELARHFRVQVIYPADVTSGVESPGAKSCVTISETLDQLFVNTGLEYEFVNERTITVRESRQSVEGRQRPSDVELNPEVVPAFVAQRDDTSAALEEVVVTGSRIPREDLFAVSPVQIVGTEVFQDSGALNVADVINLLPAFGVPGSVDTKANFQGRKTGLNTLNLRNLGGQRTLVLVDGRRHVGGSAGLPTVDVSMIPVALVDRVEIVTGGASAVYGSDAVGGVVNFITKRDFKGTQFNSQIGRSFEGGASEGDFSLIFGDNFAGDRGNATVYLGYSDRGALGAGEREISANDSLNSSFGVDGHFFAPDFAAGGWTQDDSTGLFNKNFVAEEDGFNRSPHQLLRLPSERTQLNGNLSFQVNDFMTFFSDTSFVDFEATGRLPPLTIGQFSSVGNIANITIPIDNPFMPTELRDLILAADPTADHAVMFRRFAELGTRSLDIERRVFRQVLGLDGHINENWSYNAYYQYGKLTSKRFEQGDFNTLNFYNGLQVEADGNGGYQCLDELWRALGCVPINVFGAGSITEEALDWVRADSIYTESMIQNVAAATVTGTLMELPAGDLGIAFGAEWRQEESQFLADGLTSAGLTSVAADPPTVGDYDVYEVFGEAILPVLSDAPFARYLGLELAARYSDYSTIGSNGTYKASLDWRPTDDFRVRGGYSTALRAPNISELHGPTEGGSSNIVDPCALGGMGGLSGDGVTVYPVQSPEVQANCATIPGTATLDPFALNITEPGGPITGNPALQEEQVETWTAGFVYSPHRLSDLNITVDYFDIEITDAIGSFDAQTVVDQCVRQPDFPANDFCGLITRQPASGLIVEVAQKVINAAVLSTSGVDLAVDYLFPLYDGDMSVTLYATYTDKYEYIPHSGGVVVDSLGEIRFPEWRAFANLTYDWRKYRFAWHTRFVDGMNVSNDNPSFGTVPGYIYHDIHARYFMGADDRFEVFAGIKNVFDKKPPFLGQGVNGDVLGTNTASDIYDVIGRYGYLGLVARFGD